MKNVTTDEGHKEWQEKMFTKKGYKTILNFTNSLMKIYYEKKDYPYTLGLILGMPNFGYSKIIKSEEALLERVKAYMQILGLTEITTKLRNGTEITFGFDEANV